MENQLCAFCDEESPDVITVTDSDGIKHLMCRECLESEDSELTCRCGGSNYAFSQNSDFVACGDCWVSVEINSFFHLPYSLKESHEKFVSKMKQHRKTKEQKKELQRIIRQSFDVTDNLLIAHDLIEIAQNTKVNGSKLDADFINEMITDLEV